MAEAADETVNASVADLALRDEEGVEVRFGDLYKDRRAMIVFVREYVEDLGKVPAEHFQEANVRLVVVGCAPFKFIKGFRERSGFAYDLYCDPDRVVYQALGLKTTLSTQGAGSIHIKSSSIKGVLSSTWQALKGLKKQGDFSQQGGSFVVETDGKVSYSHLDQGTLDHVPINDLLEKAGVKTVDFSAIHAATSQLHATEDGRIKHALKSKAHLIV